MQSWQKNLNVQSGKSNTHDKKVTAFSPYCKAIVILFWNHMRNADTEGFSITMRAKNNNNKKGITIRAL